MNFQAMTIKQKLYCSYGAVLCIALVMGGASVHILSNLAARSHALADQTSARMFVAGSLAMDAAHLVSLERGITLRCLGNDPATAEKYVNQYHDTAEDAKKALGTLRTISRGDDLTAVDTVESKLNRADSLFEATVQHVHAHAFQAVYEDYKGDLLPALTEVETTSSKIRARAHDELQQSADEMQSQVSQGHLVIAILLTIGIVVGAGIIFIVRKLDAELVESAAELSEGSSQLAGTASQVSESSQSLARDTSAQAAMIEETSASAEQINSMARRNAQSAADATRVASEAVGTTAESSRAVAECVHAMDAIGESSNKIAKTLQVIDKIAFQTNILALNAAVEAARAGEAGMGFAVVAEEVRNLAQRCATAAQETSSLVDESLKNSGTGRVKIASLVDSGKKVNDAFARMKVLVEEIGNSSQEQGRGIDQIGRSISKMEQGTQKSAANAEQSAAAAEQLTTRSQTLQQTASTLNRLVGLAGSTSGNLPSRMGHPHTPTRRTPAAVASARPALRSVAKPKEDGSEFNVAFGSGAASAEEDFRAF